MPKKHKGKSPVVKFDAAKTDGNPLVAFRCPSELLGAYVKKHGSKAKAWVAIRRHMQIAVRV